jgi:hypothetical protein
MTATTFDPTRYPRTYRHRIVFRISMALFGVLVLLGAVVPSLSGAASTHGLVRLVTAAFGAAVLILPWRHRVVLGPHFLETRALRTHRIERTAISGYRRRSVPRGGIVYLVNVEGRPRPVTVRAIKDDADFRAWFAGLKDADTVDRVAHLQEIALDERLGATPKARLAAAGRARRFANWTLCIALVPMLWTIIYPHPRAPLLIVEAAFVPLAILIAARSNGLFSLDGFRNSGRGELPFVMGSAIFALGYRAWTDMPPTNWTGLVVASVIAGTSLAVVAVVAVRSPRAPTPRLIYGAIRYALYAAAVLALANGEFDGAAGNSQLVTITHARKTHGRYSETYFTLSQMPADVGSTEIEVSRGDYQRHHVGDQICLRERDGALGWHWLQLRSAAACQQR